MISAITIITAITPVAAPALNIPPIAAQLCKPIKSTASNMLK